MKKIFSVLTLFAIVFTLPTSCADANRRETAVTAAQGPADTALPQHAVFAIDKTADERLISAAKSFCERTLDISQGGTVIELLLSENARGALLAGKADAALLENFTIPGFSPVCEAFRYRSYEHYSMTVNSAAVLRSLSDILGANVFAGFYAGSNVFLSRGTLDSKYKAISQVKSDGGQEPGGESVTTLAWETTGAISVSDFHVTESAALEARIEAFENNGWTVEFSTSELDSPALLKAVSDIYLQPAAEQPGRDDDDQTAYGDGSVPGEPEPATLTRAFTGIKPVWLVFADSAYEKLSQNSRAAVAESAAYMTSDIDGAYLRHEQEKINSLIGEGAVTSNDFAAVRAYILRNADEQLKGFTNEQQRLREAIARVQ